MKRRRKSRRTKKAHLYGTLHDSGYISDNILEHLLSNAQKVKSLIPLLEAFKMKIGEVGGRLAVISKGGG